MATATSNVFDRLGLTQIEKIPVQKRVIWSIEGVEKSGKTHLSLTAPGPLAYLDIDIGSEGVVDKMPRTDVFMRRYLYARDIRKGYEQLKAASKVLWSQFVNDYYELLEASKQPGGPRTIVMDTATDFFNLCLNAHLGKEVQIMPAERTAANNAYGSLIKAAYAYNANLLMVHQMQPEYDNKTHLERKGFNKTGFLVQTCVQTQRKKPPNQNEFEYKVTLCRANTGLEGETFDGRMYDFATLAETIVEGSNVEDWQ